MRIKCRRFLGLLLCWLTIYAALMLLYCVYLRNGASSQQQKLYRRFKLIPDYKCECRNSGEEQLNEEEVLPTKITNFLTNATRRILFYIHPQSSVKQRKSIVDFFNYFKVPLVEDQLAPHNNHLLLEIDGIARFSLIVFESYQTYNFLSNNQKEFLHKFCTKHAVGIISFLNLENDAHFNFTNFAAFGDQKVDELAFVANSPIRNISKAGCSYSLPEHEQFNWTLFRPTSTKFKPLLNATSKKRMTKYAALLLEQNHLLFSAKPEHWMIKIALLEATNYLAPNIYNEDLERFIQIDIDDVFVGTSGSRFTEDDVNAILATQRELQHGIDNFTYTLGFSGYYFRHGNQLEIQGDELLLANGAHFHWFPHMWRHNHAHEHSADYLLALMAQNKMFANNSRLTTSLQYAVSPQHSGVYPIYQPLYDGWKQIWNIQVTSTEEYPHFKPASKRRGFIHSNIHVLPRQTCGLFTHTQFFHAYPGGIQNFLNNIYGGDLFKTILMNKFSIFMTHQQNYANDRLGSFAFLNLIKFIKCWTNLRLRWIEPKKMAQFYFQQYPGEKTLLYTDVTSDGRHKRMLPSNYSGGADLTLPNLVILGPQKTGTTALAMFLQLHPNISTNVPIPGSFEELQFFAGPNYAKGMEWYSSKFANTSSAMVIFEKTANYFDNPTVPEAIHALIPKAKLLVILDDPVKRAYSWYQHMRAHNDSIALKYSVDEILLANFTETEKLRRRMLFPGLFVKHLDHWLDFFHPSQLIIVDADQLRNQPHFVLHELFAKLELPPLDGLAHRLKFSPEKGFYCLIREENGGKKGNGTDKTGQKLHCLGSSKGRRYEAMSHSLRRHLEAFFSGPNKALKQFLHKYQFPTPSFLANI